MISGFGGISHGQCAMDGRENRRSRGWQESKARTGRLVSQPEELRGGFLRGGDGVAMSPGGELLLADVAAAARYSHRDAFADHVSARACPHVLSRMARHGRTTAETAVFHRESQRLGSSARRFSDSSL